MAYNNGFPVGYPMYYQPQYQVPYTQGLQVPPANQQQQTQPQNNGGIVRVQNENEARMYPVAPGNSIIFIDENAPYCYTKTVDMSQLDRPKFDRYRLVKEEDAPAVPQQSTSQQVDMSLYVTKAELDDFRNEINGLLKAAPRPVTKSKEAKADV